MRYRLLLGMMVVMSLVTPGATPALADPSPGAIVIPLVTSQGEATDAAVAGFDLLATEEGIGDAASSVHGAKRGYLAVVSDDATPTETESPLETAGDTGQENDEAPATEEPVENRETPSSPADTPQPTTREAIASEIENDYALFTDPIALDYHFAVAGVTWDSGRLPVGATVEMRTLDGDTWSDWYFLAVEESGLEGARPGTEYYVSGASSAIQVRIGRGDGDLPAGLRIDISYNAEGPEVQDSGTDLPDVLPSAESLAEDVINPDDVAAAALTTDTMLDSLRTPPSPSSGEVSGEEKAAELVSAVQEVASFELAPASLANNAGIQPRSAWGADESLTTWVGGYAKFEGVIIHHTAGTNTYTQAQVPGVLQGVHRYQAITLGWGDIGYNVLIDKYGGRWEGRKGTLASPAGQMKIGAHAAGPVEGRSYGWNSGTMGISVLGNFVDVDPSQTILTAIEEVAAWKFIQAGVDPSSAGPMKSSKRSSVWPSTVPSEGRLPRIAAHLDVMPTACPGRIYNYMGEIRARVAALYGGASSWVLQNGTWYLVDSSGHKQTGWAQVNGTWYYLSPDGAMATGWVSVGNFWYYLDTNGAMQTGWILDRGTWYYLDANGAMQTGWLQLGKNWYFLDPSSGAMYKGWMTLRGARYYMGSTGIMATGWATIAGSPYYFNASGAMQTGWITVGSARYFLDSDGVRQSGWLDIDGSKYYFNATGERQTGWLLLGKTWFYLDSTTGAMKTGWVTISGSRYFLGADGVMTTGWLQQGDNWYYFRSTGVMQTGWVNDRGSWYFLNSSGIRQTGWVANGGSWYYLNADGVRQTGWQKVGEESYYFDTNGVMQKGWLLDGKTWYYLNTTSGARQTGWAVVRGTWYYLDSAGVMQTGWLLQGKTWYYLNASGAMTKGWVAIGGVWYYLKTDGAMATGQYVINGKTNIFTSSGQWVR